MVFSKCLMASCSVAIVSSAFDNLKYLEQNYIPNHASFAIPSGIDISLYNKTAPVKVVYLEQNPQLHYTVEICGWDVRPSIKGSSWVRDVLDHFISMFSSAIEWFYQRPSGVCIVCGPWDHLKSRGISTVPGFLCD
jgi:hypothetical protein